MTVHKTVPTYSSLSSGHYKFNNMSLFKNGSLVYLANIALRFLILNQIENVEFYVTAKKSISN